MGVVRTEITLVNAGDTIKAADGFIPESEVRRLTVNAMVDTGARTETKGLLVINEETREKLGLRIIGIDSGTLADGTEGSCQVAGPLEVIWKDRRTNCDALVLSDAGEILLGAIPLEALDLTVNPKKQEVVGVHGDQPLHRI